MEQEKVLFNATCCYLLRDGKILLGLKTQKIGKGCWNGYGGGIEAGEHPKEAVVREFAEESGGVIIDPSSMEKIGIGYFHNTKSDGETFMCIVHFYTATAWEGEVRESEEMVTPTWFDINSLPLHLMMPTDREWLPVALAHGKKIVIRSRLGPHQKELLAPSVIEFVEVFPN